MTIALLLISVAVLPNQIAAGPTGDSCEWTLARVRLEAEANRQRLRSILVEDDTIGSTFSRESRTHETVAVKDRLRFVEIRHLSRVTGRDDGRDFEWRKVFLTPEMLTTVWVIERFCKMSREQARNDVGRTARYLFFMESTGWWPPGESSSADDEPEWALCKALRNEQWRVERSVQFIDKHRCVGLDLPGRDRMRLDVDRGCAVIWRERQWNGKRVVYENSDWREMSLGIWLPWKLRRTISLPPDSAPRRQGHRNVFTEATETVVKMNVNCLSEDVFAFKPEPGTLMFDAERLKTWQIAGRESEVLDAIVRATGIFASARSGSDGRLSRSYLAVDLLLPAAAISPWALSIRRQRRRELSHGE